MTNRASGGLTPATDPGDPSGPLDPVDPPALSDGALATSVANGIAWSTVTNVVLRLGSFLVGVLLARLLAPEAFGVYAVALTVQAVLMSLADLGLSSELIRSDDPERRAPTVATLGLASGVALSVLVALTSTVVANSMNSPESGPVIAVLGLTLALAGAGVVPYAMLLREFNQRALFGLAAVDFVISTSVTVSLVMAHVGPMSLAIGRVCAQSVILVLQHVVTHRRPRLSLDRELAGPILRYGLPIAGANLFSWILLNVDNVVVARATGTVNLGLYVLAFNISNWPMSVIGQVVRSVALPGFARSASRAESLTRAIALTWALSLPAGTMLVVFARPLVRAVYGEVWLPSAPVLMALGVFGGLRVVFDLVVAFLLAQGRSGWVFAIQVWWLVALTPGMILATQRWGIQGAGWVHVVVAVTLIAPAYALAVRRAGAGAPGLVRATLRPTLATLAAAAVALAVTRTIQSPWPALGVGGLLAAGTYLVLVAQWLRSQVGPLRRSTSS